MSFAKEQTFLFFCDAKQEVYFCLSEICFFVLPVKNNLFLEDISIQPTILAARALNPPNGSSQGQGSLVDIVTVNALRVGANRQGGDHIGLEFNPPLGSHCNKQMRGEKGFTAIAYATPRQVQNVAAAHYLVPCSHHMTVSEPIQDLILMTSGKFLQKKTFLNKNNCTLSLHFTN
uniref:Uncharacterized protein n=1 Tax=Heterorhabditis bacteriophora TaxID=37862 RepID=A0A1I7XBT1_HETBA